MLQQQFLQGGNVLNQSDPTGLGDLGLLPNLGLNTNQFLMNPLAGLGVNPMAQGLGGMPIMPQNMGMFA